MEVIYIIMGLIGIVIVLEVLKHMFFKKSAKTILIFFVILVLFLSFSYTFRNIETLEDNKIVQTGALITGEIVNLLKEKGDISSFINSTVKSNKLFKS